MKTKVSEAVKLVRGHRYEYMGREREPALSQRMHLWECRWCGHRTYRAVLSDGPRQGEGGSVCPFGYMG